MMTMKRFATILSLCCCMVAFATVAAFQPRPTTASFGIGQSVVTLKPHQPSGTALHVFGSKKKKTAEAIEAESKYWMGEWVCKDCGYIYNRVSKVVWLSCLPSCEGERMLYC
jgi:hypothetical protein